MNLVMDYVAEDTLANSIVNSGRILIAFPVTIIVMNHVVTQRQAQLFKTLLLNLCRGVHHTVKIGTFTLLPAVI